MSNCYLEQICDNGILQFNLEWRLYYPYPLETSSWYDDIAVIAPFWSYSNEYLMHTLGDIFPNATSKVYYNSYQASFNADVHTREILARAKADVADSGE